MAGDFIKGNLARQRTPKVGEFATWDIQAKVDGGLHGGFKDWPANIQDGVMRAVAECEPKPGYSVRIVSSGCYKDGPGEPFYIRVVVQEFPPEVRH